MTMSAPAAPARPAARRMLDRAWVGGVCAGLSAHLGWPVLALRLVFMGLSLWKLSGIALYAALWLVLPPAPAPEAAGLAAARRLGTRTKEPAARWGTLIVWAILVLYAVGVAGFLHFLDHGVLGNYAPMAVAFCVGVALVWRQRDEAMKEESRRWLRTSAIVAGSVIAAAAGAAALMLHYGSAEVLSFLVVATAAVVLAVVAAAPWVARPVRQGSVERDALLLEQAKADMAAHLHDSVLQTLAMIQRQADDATAVASLARRQERELRHWLYDDATEEGTVKSQLTQIASETEDAYTVSIDLVTVGDAPLTIELEALVAAAREAIANAAKHSGDTKVNVYAEVGGQVVDVFVRDHGRGFDPAEIGEDRLGIRQSILGRMHRYGGTVEIRSTPGEGTEIHMEMAR